MSAAQRLLLSVYPLTREIVSCIEEKSGFSETRSLCLGELKRNSPTEILAALRKLGGRNIELWVIVSDHNYQPYLQILLLLASLIPANAYFVADYTGEGYRVNRYAIWLTSPWKLLHGTLRGLFSLLRAVVSTKRLLRAPRIADQRLGDTPAVLYLKTNLWMGVQAGGSIGHVAGVVNGFSRKGCRIDVYTAEKLPMLDENVKVVQVPICASGGIPLELNGYIFQHVFDGRLGNMIADSIRPRMVYQRNCLVNYSGVLLSRSLDVPLVIEYNGSEVWVSKNWGIPLRFFGVAQRIEEVNLRHAHLIVVVSEVLRDELLERGIEPERILFYPNCIDPMVFDPTRWARSACEALRRKWNIPLDAVLCTFIGTFGPWHGVDVLAKAVRDLAACRADWLREKKLHFLFVGDGQLMPKVRELLVDTPSEFYSFTGLVPQADAPGFLAMSDILLSPHVPNPDGSRFFGSPTKLFEYMAMGKPIIASELEQIGQVLAGSWHIGRRGVPKTADELARSTAILITPGNGGELALALEYLAENQEARLRLGAEARELALKQYTWEQQVKEVIRKLDNMGARCV